METRLEAKAIVRRDPAAENAAYRLAKQGTPMPCFPEPPLIAVLVLAWNRRNRAGFGWVFARGATNDILQFFQLDEIIRLTA